MNRILGIDSSTKGVAWCLVVSGKPTKWGEIELSKTVGMNQKLLKIAKEFPTILEETQPQHIFIERTIFVKSAATARVLAYVVGALMISLLAQGYNCDDVDVATWKSFIGYTNLNRKFVTSAKLKLGRLPGGKLCEEMRKSQTQRVIKHNFPDMDISSHDISDACAIALYGYNLKCKKIMLNKGKEIALDIPKLTEMGLGGLL